MNGKIHAFWDEFKETLHENGDEYELLQINDVISAVKRNGRSTALFLVADAAKGEVCLYKKEGLSEICLLRTDLHAPDTDSLLLEIDKNCKKSVAAPQNAAGGKSAFVPQYSAGGKTVFKLGQVWEGRSYADLINKIFHKQYKQYMRATLDLAQFGGKGIAWIVSINGEPHGMGGDLWINSMVGDGEVIEEKYVGDNRAKIRAEFLAGMEITFSDRLTFQKDPDDTGNMYKAKCLGYYTLKMFDTDRLLRVWERRSESYPLTLK